MAVREVDLMQDIRSVLDDVSVIKKDIVEKILLNKYSPHVSVAYVDMIMRKMQARNDLLLSSDGYVMTRGAYVRITGDRFFNELKIGYNEKVKDGIDYTCSRDGTSIIPCMYIYADLQPYSEYLLKNKEGWDISFITVEHDEKPSRLYSVAYFAKGYESIKAELLLMSERGLEHVEKERIRRIALFENPEMSFLSPKGIGITSVACLDENEQCGFRVIRAIPADEAWD